MRGDKSDGQDNGSKVHLIPRTLCKVTMTIGDLPAFLQRTDVQLQGRNSNIMAAEKFTAAPPHGVAGAPNEAALLELMERTNYAMIQENGQRKYGGPPPVWEGPAPLRGCEVFVGKIPRDCYEDELVPVFEKIGLIYELRLMMDFSGSNRGYCFVMYTNRDDARRAVKELNNFEIRKGRFLGVCLSVDNCRLFVGGIPKNKQRDEILSEMTKVTEGVVDVIVYPSATDKTKNRGFAFVEYESHRAAAMARRKLIPGRIQLWGHPIAVDWAEPEQEVDEEVMSKVKILYVRNLMLSTSEDVIRETFTKAVGKENCVERVKKIRDYAFVHFREREPAMEAMHGLDGSTLDGSLIEVCLAKPVDKNDYVRFTRGTAGRATLPGVRIPDGLLNADLKTGEVLVENYGYSYGDMPTYAGAYYQQLSAVNAAAMAASRGFQPRSQVGQFSPTTAGRGSIVRGRGRGAAGMRGAGGRGYLSGVRGCFRKHPIEERLYDLLPDMVLTPTNPITLKPQSKSRVQILEEYCQKHGLGTPIYQLQSTFGGDVQLFLYKVSVPALANQYPNHFQPTKLCRSVEEAKHYAAEHVLSQLGVPMDAGGDCGPAPVASPPATIGYAVSAQTAGRALYPMANGSAAAVPSYATTLSSAIPVTTSYVISPQKMAHPVSQPHGHGDMGGFEAGFPPAFAPAPVAYTPYH